MSKENEKGTNMYGLFLRLFERKSYIKQSYDLKGTSFWSFMDL